MKITVHLDMDEGDYVAILQVASMKRVSSEELIRTAIREYLVKESQSFRTEAGGQQPGEGEAAGGNAKRD